MNRMKVGGTAVTAGLSRNGIIYTPEELKKFAPTLVNKPILKDHYSLTDNTIGRTDSAKFIVDKVNYGGWIKDESTQERIADKRIQEVSIGAIVGKLVEDEDSGNLIARDIEAMELSTTPTPGVKGTSIQNCLKELAKAKTYEERLKVKPIAENTILFESYNEIQKPNEVNKLVEKEKKVEEEVKEEKTEKKVEEKIEEKIEEASTTTKIDFDVDTSKIDEALKKSEKLLEIKQKLKEMDEEESEKEPEQKEEEKPAEEKKEVPKMKGKVSDKAEKKDTTIMEEGYVIENVEHGQGLALWRQR